MDPIVVVYEEGIWDCGHTPEECSKTPSPDVVKQVLREVEESIPKPKKTRTRSKLKVAFTDGYNTDVYETEYPANLYYAKRVRKALKRIYGLSVYIEKENYRFF